MSATSIAVGLDRATPQPRRRPSLPHRQGVTPRPAVRPAVRATTGAAGRTLRLTRRGRLVVTLILTALIVTGFMVVAGSSVATRQAGTPEPVTVVEVERGQTLWGIASSVADPGEVREMVYRIRELNSLPSSALVEGQELAVPAR